MIRVRVVAWVSIVVASGLFARAQSPDAEARFEVASVKPSDPGAAGPLAAIPIVRPPVGGRFTAANISLRLLVRLAYSVQDFQIDGGPSWQLSQKFDISAKAEDSFTGGLPEMLPMVRRLLADRFKLETHAETRELPVYALVVARSDGRLGTSLTASSDQCENQQAEAQKMADALAKGGPAALAALLPRPGEKRPCSITPLTDAGGFGMKASGQPISTLVQLLTQATGRLVRDKTGLSGLYDWEMRFDPAVLLSMVSQLGLNLPAGAAPPASDNPSLMTALREQLGLKLDSERGPVDVIVVDSADMPTPD